MTKLETYVSKAPVIIGSTTINHEARIRLSLNCSEYCLLDHLSKKTEKGDQADTLTIYINTGFTVKETQMLLNSLILKGFVRIETEAGKYSLTTKWEEAFPDIEKEFDSNFWRIERKVVWTGTRRKALEYYVKLRKKYSSVFLMDQRNNYFNYLTLQKELRKFDQQRMMCQVFLNPANERFLEDYTEYIEELNKKYGKKEEPTIEPVTRKQVMEAYGKDNNQQGSN
jgi:hypothetical protein